MKSRKGLLARMRRILELAERVLEDLAGLPPGAQLFDRHLALVRGLLQRDPDRFGDAIPGGEVRPPDTPLLGMPLVDGVFDRPVECGR